MRQHSLTRSLTTASLATLLGLAAQPAFAAADHAQTSAAITAPNVRAAEARQKASDHTQTLMVLQKQWAKAKGAEKSRVLKQLTAKAKERRDVIAALLETDPTEAIRFAIPDTVQLRMPADVAQLLEQQQEIEGNLEIIYEDTDDGQHKLHHFVTTPFGERFELHTAGMKRTLRSGDRVKAYGLMVPAKANRFSVDAHLAVDAPAENLTLLAADGQNISGSAQLLPSLPNTLGEQKTAVILVNFQDNASEPWTPEQANDVVFNQSNGFFRENSFQQTWLSGNVFGWYTLPLSSTSCDYQAMASAARQAVQADGVNLSGYDRQVFAFPFNSSCGWAGLGSVGGTPSSAWINGYMDLRTVSHELGHNLGLYHGHALECGAASDGSNCTSLEYGDTTDVMGKASSAHFTAFQKELLGWLNTDNLIEVTASGSYSLSPYASEAAQAPKALKLLKETDATTGHRTWYYIEYRQPTGYDSSLAARGNTSDGVVVHTGSEATRNSSYLLDMTPDSDISDWYDPALVRGSRYTDARTGITIDSDWADGTNATISIELAPQACVTTAPYITATPVQSGWLSAGTRYSYKLAVTNRNSADCPSSNYNLNVQAPSGWNTAWVNNSLTLAPGETGTLDLAVTSPVSAVDGFYSLAVKATDADNRSDSVTLTYVISNPDNNNAPVATDDAIMIDSITAVTIPVMSNDSDPDGDTLSIAGVTQGNKGSVTINADGTLTYRPERRFKSGDSFTYSISDGAQTDYATVTIQLQQATSSGNGGGKGNGKKP